MRLIDADAFIDFLRSESKARRYENLKIDGLLTVENVLEAVISELDGTALDGYKNAPTIEERKKGVWIEVEVLSYDIYGNKTWSSKMQCDQCGFRHTAIEGHMAQYKFCPYCGADMKQREE